MTTKQKNWYWREWSACKKARPEFTDADRKALITRALGKPKSSKLLTNSEFTLVIAEMQAITRPAALDTQLRAINMARKNKMAKIVSLAPIPYIAELLSGPRFKAQDFDALSDAALHQLLFTVTARAPKPAPKLNEYELECALAVFTTLAEPERFSSSPGSSRREEAHTVPETTLAAPGKSALLLQ